MALHDLHQEHVSNRFPAQTNEAVMVNESKTDEKISLAEAAAIMAGSEAEKDQFLQSLEKRFDQLTIWDAPAQWLDENHLVWNTIFPHTKLFQSLRGKPDLARLDEEVDRREKLLLLTHSQWTPMAFSSLWQGLAPVAETIMNQADRQKKIPGTLGNTFRRIYRGVAFGEDMQAEIERCKEYLYVIRQKIKDMCGNELWQPSLSREQVSSYQRIGEKLSAYYSFCCVELENCKRKGMQMLDKNVASLIEMNPNTVRINMQTDHAFREISRRRLSVGMRCFMNGDLDMLERVIFLGAEGKELGTALNKVNVKTRKAQPTGWLGNRIETLQSLMTMVPKVPSPFGMLGGALLIALPVLLIAWLWYSPELMAFLHNNQHLVIGGGILLSIVLGLIGGFWIGLGAMVGWLVVARLLQSLLPVATTIFVLMCLLGLGLAILGIRWMLRSTPRITREKKKEREEFIVSWQGTAQETLGYIDEILARISPMASTSAGANAITYYQAAAETVRGMLLYRM